MGGARSRVRVDGHDRAPRSTITSPAASATIADGALVTITGTATDAGGTVGGVEVSTDDGATWHEATGTTSWSYSWVAHGAPSTTIKARAADDSGNLELAPASVTVNIGCPCGMFGPSVPPELLDAGDINAVEVGVRFKADLDGTITGVRFYKSALNTGTHIGNLWTANGTLLATRDVHERDAHRLAAARTSPTPVSITAGTTYVASYYAPRGHYSADPWFHF